MTNKNGHLCVDASGPSPCAAGVRVVDIWIFCYLLLIKIPQDIVHETRRKTRQETSVLHYHSRRRSRGLSTTSSATGERARRQNARPQPPRRVVIISAWSATTRINCRSASTPRPPQRLRRQWQLRARAAAVAPPTNNYPERFAGPAQNLPAVPAQATTRPPKDARRTYLEGAQINHGSGPAPRPARRLRPLRIATARHGEHRVRVHAANIGTGGSRSRGNLRATPVMVIKADGTACRT